MTKLFITLLLAATALTMSAGNTRQEGPLGKPDPKHKWSANVSSARNFTANAATRRAPRKDAAADQTLYAYLRWADTWHYQGNDYVTEGLDCGMWKLPTDATSDATLYWQDPGFNSTGDKLYGGWLTDGKLHALTNTVMYQQIKEYNYLEYDWATGELLSRTAIPINNESLNCFLSICAYNPNDGCLYGFGIAPDRYNDAWNKVKVDGLTTQPEATTLQTITWDSPIRICRALCFDEVDNVFFGLTKNGNLVRITPEGEQTVVCELGLEKNLSGYDTGMEYLREQNKIVICINYSDDTAALYEVTFNSNAAIATTGTVNKIRDYQHGEQYGFFIYPYNNCNPMLTARMTLDEFPFNEGQLSGNALCTLPTTMSDGTPLTGQMGYKVMIDDVEATSQTANAGSQVTIPLTLTRGTHTVKFIGTKDGHDGLPVIRTQFFGNDDSAVPQNVVWNGETNTLTWSPVTTSAHQGYINPQEISYKVLFDGQPIATEAIADTAATVALPQDVKFNGHVLSVVATFDGNDSEPGNSDYIAYGEPLDLDVTIEPTAEQVPAMTIVRAGTVNEGWTVQTLYNGDDEVLWFNSNYSNGGKLNEWLLTPPINFNSTDDLYAVTLDAAMRQRNADESFEIWLLSSPNVALTLPEDLKEGETKKLIMPEVTLVNQLQDDDVDHYNTKFNIDAPGTYYVAIRATSSDNYSNYGVCVRNIQVKKDAGSAAGPKAVSNLTATAAEQGGLTATVAFTAPTEQISGEPFALGAPLTAKIECKNGQDIVSTTTVNCTAGQEVSQVITSAQGNNTITVTCYNGDNEGVSANVVVYTGVDIPAKVTNLSASLTDDAMGLHLTWTAPTKGENGGYINPETLYYKIMVETESYYTEGNETEYTFRLPEGTPQANTHFGVVSMNEAGGSNYFTSSQAVIGTPYTLPVEADFGPSPISPYDVKAGSWTIDNPASYVDGANFAKTNKALINNANLSDNKNGLVAFPRFNTVGAESVTMSITTWSDLGSPVVKLKGLIHNMVDFQQLYKIEATGEESGWTTYSFQLPENFLNQKYIWLFIETLIGDSEVWPTMIAEYSLTNDATGVAFATNTSCMVYATKGAIHISAAEPSNVEIYSLDGKAIANLKGFNGQQTIPAAAGTYIVKTDQITKKIMVK